MEETKVWDVLIIGAGPAGLAAALYSARALRTTVVIESQMLPGGQIATTGDVEDYPGIAHTMGPQLSMDFKDHAEKFGATMEFGEAVVAVDLADKYLKRVTTRSPLDDEDSEGRVFQARTVIIATGAAPRTLGVPGEDLLAVEACRTVRSVTGRSSAIGTWRSSGAATRPSMKVCTSRSMLHASPSFTGGTRSGPRSCWSHGPSAIPR